MYIIDPALLMLLAGGERVVGRNNNVLHPAHAPGSPGRYSKCTIGDIMIAKKGSSSRVTGWAV